MPNQYKIEGIPQPRPQRTMALSLICQRLLPLSCRKWVWSGLVQPMPQISDHGHTDVTCHSTYSTDVGIHVFYRFVVHYFELSSGPAGLFPLDCQCGRLHAVASLMKGGRCCVLLAVSSSWSWSLSRNQLKLLHSLDPFLRL